MVGAIVCPTALHRWSDWGKAQRAFEMHRTGAYCISEQEARNLPFAPKPPAPPSPLPGGSDTSYVELAHPNLCYALGVPSYSEGFIVGGTTLLPWLLAVILGGISAAIVGYLLPTFYVVAFQGVPSVVRAYVRWLNGPEA